ncbi:hypothetical protein GobsT_51730 [Gemmata obscuriglobus]|nr:hypothetical protein [Gemmata obscuriglobus]QEG30368.1 hypothetical protein GobsT_51730 [Gemmata obscuriglobus]VTS09692.1 unnamed protein product [Gemmata obscuriglobus UQM 2246]
MLNFAELTLWQTNSPTTFREYTLAACVLHHLALLAPNGSRSLSASGVSETPSTRRGQRVM